MPVDPRLVSAAILVGAAFAPALVYLGILRNTERYGREGWGRLLLAFLYGAIFSVVLALVLNPVATAVAAWYRPDLDVTFLAVVVAAPIVEEAVKAHGVGVARYRLTRAVDGIVYGGAVALGFAATENLFYQLQGLAEGGVAAWATLVVVRSGSSALIHPAATGLTGLGLAWRRIRGWPLVVVAPFFGAAVLLHGVYNYGATLPPVNVAGVPLDLRLPVATLLALASFTLLRALLRLGDRRGWR